MRTYRDPSRRALAAVAVLAAAALAAPGLASAAGVKTSGRYLVVFDGARTARSSAAVLARAGVRRAGRGDPKLGIATVRGPRAALRALRDEPGVKSVSPEYLRPLRRAPNDPAFSTPETAYGGLPGGAPIQWSLARERFPEAWDVTTGAGAVVGVIDSGADGSHPELSAKIASADTAGGADSPLTDSEGHGTHVSGLACAATGNGVGIAGAGWDCRIALVKVPSPTIPDEGVIEGIRIATDRGAQAINMSFGGGPGTPAIDASINYAVQHGVILVASASNNSDTDQGAPASQLQPNDAPNIDAGRGLVVTAADFFDRRPSTGQGPQISLAAYGFYAETEGPPGLVSTFPGNRDTPADGRCAIPIFVCVRRNLGGDDRYAYLQGTSMSAPQVTALAAMVSTVNPTLSLQEKLRLIKETARRAGGWNPDFGWGILDAGAAVDAARHIDRIAPSSRARGPHRVRVRRKRRGRASAARRRRRAKVRVRWSGSDPRGNPGLVPSGIRSFDLYMRRGKRRYRLIRRNTTRRSTKLRLRPGTYRFYTRALDKAGNREAAPRRPDFKLRVRR